MENGKTIVIGNATLIYDKLEKLIQGYFTPTMNIDLDSDIVRQLRKIPCSDKSEEIQNQAELIISAWFSQVTDIELADRTQYKIASSIKSCTKHPDSDKIKQCIIEFSLQPL